MDDLKEWKALALEHRGITMALAEFVATMRDRPLPPRTREVLRQALVDAIGCGLFGLTTDWARIIHRFARAQGGPAESALWCGGERIGAAAAALAAGTAIHSFDFDDHSRAKIHPGAVVVPVVLALGERCRSPGHVLLAAMAAGYETMNRVSQAANPGRARMRGWHLTGTCGTFAAAAAASVILGLDAATTASAFGLAGTQSAGLWAFTADAAMSKRMHPGKAAQDGLNAAVLAANGFQGPRYILEAADGSFLYTMSDAPRPWMITEGLGSRWHSDETCFKPHACCGSNHACVDAAIELVGQHGVDVLDIERIIAGVADVVRTQTGFDYRADSVLNAQMSLQYNVAVALHDRQAYLEQFTPQRIIEPAVCETARRVEIEVDPEIDRKYPEIYGGRLTILLKDGRRLTKRVDYSRGMPENPMSGQEIERKFRSLATAAVGQSSADEILSSARAIFEASSAKPLADLLGAARLVKGDC
jgi:2-methylcitrate dehydratase PrpD